MPTGDFREYGHKMVDWIADYFDRIETLPVLSQIEPGSLLASLPDSAPESGEDFRKIFGDVESVGAWFYSYC